MNVEFYEQLNGLVDVYKNSSSNGEEIICFNLIKDIVDGVVLKDDVRDEKLLLAKKQLAETIELFQIIGVTMEYKEELMKIIS